MSKSRGQPVDGHALAARLLEEIARRRISRQALAEKAKVSLSTLEKGLSGRRPLTLATIVRLEDALGIALRDAPTSGANGTNALAASAPAPDDLGGYSRTAVSWLEGAYLTIRPSFGERGAVYAYRTDITWDDASARLLFREAARLDHDFTQFGSVAIPHQSGHIYFVTNRHGQHRLVIVSRPTITGEMHGLLATLQAGRGAHLSPVATPIVMRPLQEGETPQYGRVTSRDRAFPTYRALLKRTIDEQFVSLILPG